MLKYSRWGLAHTNGETITLHEGFKEKEWEGLKEIILRHERRHHTRPYDKEDLLNDFKDEDEMPTIPLITFMLMHPTSLTYLIPTDSQMKLKPSQIIFWATTILGFLIGWYVIP